ncbi:MAG: folate family ECF transporter S component [Oscillospiraceae bacterium]|nr:folate family ECF transporter S component [Oscillospiraceae bacterium]
MNEGISVRSVSRAAALAAAEVALSRFLSVNTFNMKIGFGFVPIVLCAVMLGPVWAAAVYALSDFLGAVLFPIGPYFPGFTLTAALSGLAFGFFLYRREVRIFPHVIGAVFTSCVVLGLGLNTLWIALLYEKAIWAIIPGRLLQCVILISAQTALIPLICRVSERLKGAA